MNAHNVDRVVTRFTGVASIAALVIAVVVLAGWVFDVDVLTSPVADWPRMPPLSAWVVLLSAASILLAGNGPSPSRHRRNAALACAALALLLSAARLTGHLAGHDFGIDDLGFHSLIAARAMPAGVMSPATTVGFALLNSALILAIRTRAVRTQQALCLLALLIAWLGLTRYLFGGAPLFLFNQMAVQTALTLLLLSASALARPRKTGLVVLLASEDSAGVIAQRLLPVAVLVPLAAGALALYAEHRAVLGVEQSFALFALLSALLLAGIVWASAAQLKRISAERQRAEEARKTSEERVRLILDAALDAVIAIDQTGRIIDWNPQAETLFGWSAAEALGQTLSQLIVPERYRAAHERGLEHYLSTGEGPALNRRIELSALHRDQSEFPVELAITPLRSGEHLSFSAFVRDITEKRRAETALRASQELLQSIIDNTPAVVYVKQLDGRYLLVNRRFEEAFQLQRDAVLGRTDHELFAKKAADEFRSIDLRVANSGAPLTEEEVVAHADGAHTYLSVKAPLRDAKENICGTFGISTDITERKRASERVRIQAERLGLLDQMTRSIAERQDLYSIFRVAISSLEEHLPIDFGCICLYDSALHVLEISCVGAKSRELARELGMTEHVRIDIDQNGISRCIHGEIAYEPDISQSSFILPARLARGGLRSLVIAPLSIEGKVFGVMITARRHPRSFASADCEFLRQLCEHLALAAHQAQLYASLQHAYEDLRQSQQTVMQQERLRALGQMASGIAHDINNALSPAALYAQSLLESDKDLGEEARDYLSIVQRAIDDVSQTVARLRLFSRPNETGQSFSPIDANALIQQVAHLTRVRWKDIPQERGIAIELKNEAAPDLPPLMGAENEIRDALTNLLFNAVDAMPEGGTLTLRSRLRPSRIAAQTGEASPPQVVIEVRDTGIGMTESVRNRCLEPFFTTKGERGSGLGLAMVYGMAQRHSAEVEIESELGKGTTVRLVFPAAAPQRAARADTSAKAPTKPLRILVVDDDPMILKSLKSVLESDGHFVATAEGGQTGIDEFLTAIKRGQPFAVVITDLGMPNVDGRTLAATVKAASPNTPVILLSGWGQRLQDEGGLPARVNRVLSKPPRLSELRVALAELTEDTPSK